MMKVQGYIWKMYYMKHINVLVNDDDDDAQNDISRWPLNDEGKLQASRKI